MGILIFRHDPVRIGKIIPGISRRIHRDASNGEKLIYRDDGADFDCKVTKEVTRMVDILDIVIFRHDPARIGKITPGIFRRKH